MRKYNIYLPVKIPETIGLDEYESKRPLYRLEEDYCIIIDGEPNWIRKGFIFDYASIPQLLWIFFLPYDPMYAAGALGHDLFYATELFSRETADELFYHIIVAAGTPEPKAKLMYNAVRMFGGLTYRKHTVASVMKWRHLHGIHSTLRPIYTGYKSGILTPTKEELI